MKQKISETHITKFCIDMINAIPYCYASKRLANMIKSGEPDVTGIVNRIRLEIEYKVPGKEASDLQKIQLAKWDGFSAIVGVSHSVLETVQIIAIHLNKEQRIKLKEYLISKQRAILLKEQIKEALYYINTFWI